MAQVGCKCKQVVEKGIGYVIVSCKHNAVYKGKFGVILVNVSPKEIIILATEKK